MVVLVQLYQVSGELEKLANVTLYCARLQRAPLTALLVEHSTTTTACELYYQYGFYFAPLTAAMTTVSIVNLEIKEYYIIMMENEVQIQQAIASPEDSDKTSPPHTTVQHTQKENNPKRQAAAQQATQTRKAYQEKILQELRSAKDALQEHESIKLIVVKK